jgi:hypothetical protein
MKRFSAVLAVALIGTLSFAVAAQAHIVVTGDNSGCTETTPGEKVDSTNGTTDSGIVVAGDDEMVTVTVPAGVTILHICVKTGQSGDAVVNATVPFVGPGSFTIVKTGSGGGISHVEFGISTGGETTAGETTAGETTAGETTAGETTAGETTAGETTAGETTAGETTAGETTAGETTAGETTGGSAGGTTGSGGVSGTTGGTTGGTSAAPSGGNLPFTGLPLWIPLLVAGGLLGTGVALLRRRRGEV